MPKDYFEESSQSHDSAPERSIRNIPISVNRPTTQRGPAKTLSRPTFPQRTTGSSRSGHGMLWTIGSIVLTAALLGIIAVPFIKGTEVWVTPRTHTVVFDEQAQYSAYPEGATDAPEGALLYTVITKELSESTQVTATGSERVEEYATGSLTVYNNHDANPVRLIKNTRFETPDGKVFRIRNSIIVPGKTSSGPGSIVATVYADQPGAQYNIGPIERFTLPGLKTGSPDMFGNVYARSTVAFNGGFTGERPIVAESDMKTATEALRKTLDVKAQAESVALSNGEDFAFPQLMTTEYITVPPEKGADGSVTVSQKAIVRIPVFSHAPFAKALARATSADTGDGSVSIPDTSTFTVSVAAAEMGKPLIFSLAGTATFLWAVDSEELATSLAGTEKEAFQNVISGFSGIDTAEAAVRPFWRSSFPSDPSKIRITITPKGE